MTYNVDPAYGGYQWVTKEVTGLDSNTVYNMTIAAEGAWGLGGSSEMVYFKTEGKE